MRSAAGIVVALVAAAGLSLAACAAGDSDSSATTTRSATAASAVHGDITVFAAASLTAAYEEIGDAFMIEHPDADVQLSFDSSSALVAQIREGAPADVYASADATNMAKLIDAGGNAGDPQIFATNRLQIIVEAGNPRGVATLDDLARPDLLFVTCAPQVPIGAYAQQVLDAAGVTVTPASLEENVKGIVTKVALGEADAGIVYRTDVIAAGAAAQGIDIADDVNVTATYPIVATAESGNPGGAAAFVEFVLSDQGQQILRTFGFGPP